MNEQQNKTALAELVLDEILFSVDSKRMLNLGSEGASSEAYDIQCAIQWMRLKTSAFEQAQQAGEASAPVIRFLQSNGYVKQHVQPDEADYVSALTWMAHNASHRRLAGLADLPPKVAASKALEAKGAMDLLASMGADPVVTYPMSEIMAAQSNLMLQRVPVMAKAVPGRAMSAALTQDHDLAMKAISWMVQNEVDVCAERIPDLDFKDAYSEMKDVLLVLEWLEMNGGDEVRLKSMRPEVERAWEAFTSSYPKADMDLDNVSAINALTWMVREQAQSSLNRVEELKLDEGISEAVDVMAATSLLIRYGAAPVELGAIHGAMSKVHEKLINKLVSGPASRPAVV